jgi:AcrR family transcriptional regulator
MAASNPVKRLSAEERRARILDGAMSVFAERGYDAASMSAIAAEAGITPAVIYDHFKSKAELQVELLSRETDAILMTVWEALADAAPEPPATLRAGFAAFFEWVENHPDAWRMLFRDAPTDRTVSRAYGKLGKRVTEAIGAMLRENAAPSIKQGPGAETRIAMFAQILASAQTGLAFWWYANRNVPRERVVDGLFQFCWKGLEQLGQT